MFFDDQVKTVIAWLGSSDSSTMFTIHCTFRFPCISVFKNSYNGKNFNSLEDYKRYLEQFFAQKAKFWEGKIMKLPEKSQNVVEQNKYLVW